MAGPTLDKARLRDNAKRFEDDHKKPGHGTMAAIQAVLPVIEELRAEGVSWQAIAEALGAQGLTQSDGETRKPISQNRLTALVSKLKAKKSREAGERVQRQGRADLARLSATGTKLALADELSVKSKPGIALAEDDEEAIRRRALEAVKMFLKDPEEN